MKTPFLLLATILVGTGLHAQTAVTVSTGPANAEQVWYSLQNGEVGSAPLAEWDLAFEMTGFTSSILVNTAKGLLVYESPQSILEWADVNSVDLDNWIQIENADTSWSSGALTHGNDLIDPAGLSVGWGTYNMVTHTILGTHIYVIAFTDGTYKKLRINSLAAGTYNFTYADLDGSNEMESNVVKTDFTGKNFGYFSFATGSTFDREPLTADWDLLFTKYTGFVPTPYPVSGVLQNKGVPALQVDGVPNNAAEWTSGPLDTAMNVIGSDWKSYDMDLGIYVIAEERTYFVKDITGNVWKLVFTGYGGSGNGDMSFNQEQISATGIDEHAATAGSLTVYPNPVTNGQAQVIVDVPSKQAVVRLFDMAGKQLIEQNWNGLPGLSVRTLPVDGLAKGIYLLRLESDAASITGRFVIE